MPTTFWAIALLLVPANAVHKARVLEELHGGLQPRGGGGLAAGKARGAAGGGGSEHAWALSDAQAQRLIALACDSKSYLRLCVGEALRLRSPSIDVRIAAAGVPPPPLSKPTYPHPCPPAARGFAAACTALYRFVPLCTALYRFVPLCTALLTLRMQRTHAVVDEHAVCSPSSNYVQFFELESNRMCASARADLLIPNTQGPPSFVRKVRQLG